MKNHYQQWLSKVTPEDSSQNYHNLIDYYLRAIETNPDIVTNYWYLGLAYLLDENLTQAQETWFFIFAQAAEDLQQYSQELLEILNLEALRQEKLSHNKLHLLICQQIAEIDPENINNLLTVVILQIRLQEFEINQLEEYNLKELIATADKGAIDFALIRDFIPHILEYPYEQTVLLIQSILTYTQGNEKIITKIVNLATDIEIKKQYTIYAIRLLEVCNLFPHQQLDIYRNLYSFYKKTKDIDKLIAICEQYRDRSHHFSDKLESQNLLLNTYLTVAQWDKALILAEQQYQLYEDIENHIEDLKQSQSKDSFIIGGMNFWYLKDDLSYNRKLINQTARIFQQVNQSNYPSFTFHKPQKKEKLKIGYLAHTLKNHSVGFLSRWLMLYHDKENFDIHLYLNQNREDDITEKWFKPHASKIIKAQKDTRSLINAIYDDKIDILVDLDSLTLNSSCLVTVAKPAPIQVTWLGMDATGIPNIDYFIADDYVIPPQNEQHYQEKIWRLPHTYLAVDGFEMANPTLKKADLNIPESAVIFLNVQNSAKLNPHLVNLQMQIISQVEDSYLVFKVKQDETRLKKYIYECANKFDNIQDRLRFIPYDETVELHRANLAIADIFLDTYPYNGATTTLEALWAEIPTVTRVGEQFASRNAYGFMMNANIQEGIAWTDEEYITWGVKLAKNENLRRDISWKLRQSKRKSPLWNSKQFTKEMENAYQQMWQIYLEENQ